VQVILNGFNQIYYQSDFYMNYEPKDNIKKLKCLPYLLKIKVMMRIIQNAIYNEQIIDPSFKYILKYIRKE